MINAIVSDRKIEIQAPNDLPDGSKVTVLAISAPNSNSDEMTSDEISRTLSAMDLFDATFRTNENGQDLSQAAREMGELEKKNFLEHAEKLARLFN